MGIYSSILSAPLFAFPQKPGNGYIEPKGGLGDIVPTFVEGYVDSDGIVSYRDIAAAGLEASARQMIAQFAFDVRVPFIKHTPMTKAQIAEMSPSIKKRFIVVDRRNTTWAAVKSFFKPIGQDVHGTSILPLDDLPTLLLGLLGWAVYLLILGNKNGADVPVDPSQEMSHADFLMALPGLRAESRARLAIVRGIFAAYRESDTVPGLRFLPNATAGRISERMDEILDDAYLLEASQLRRLFGLRQNLASVRRDLRSLARFITKCRPWAKGISKVVSQTGFVGSAAVEEAVQTIVTLPSQRVPLCIEPRQHFGALGWASAGMMCTMVPNQRDGIHTVWWNPEYEKWGY